jgi:hypothetical protein
MEFKDKFIGFVDILGFKQLVEAMEAGQAVPLAELLGMLASPLGRTPSGTYHWVCPASSGVQRDLDFQVTQISDCVVVSSEISPPGIINLIDHCWTAVSGCMHKGVMCRGYITRGSIYHTPMQFVGSGYQEAYSKESQVSAFKRNADERGTPFVEIDSIVCEYVKNCGDDCVKRMFSRFVKTEGPATALFPFQTLQHSFAIGGFRREFDAVREKRSNENVRRLIEKLKDRLMVYVNQSNPSAVSKAEHYLKALDRQLEISGRTDEIIEMLRG